MNFYDWSRSEVYQYIIEHMHDGCCYPWPHGRTRGGYGIIRIPRNSGKDGMIRVARLVCFLTHGSAPQDKPFVRHLCGKGHIGCFNAECLVWGSKLDNENDKKVHGTILTGEKHNMAKLTQSDVVAIRSMAATRSRSELAREFGVSYFQIRNIVLHKHWRN